MEFKAKILSRKIQDLLYEPEKTIGTAESCTSGRLAECLTAVPGASNYYKGSIVCYSDDIKVNILSVEKSLIEEKTAFSEEVAKEMVKGAIKALGTDYAIVTTGVAGPGGGTDQIPVGTIWIACGTEDDIVTLRLTGDNGRDLNLQNATEEALQLFINYYTERNPKPAEEE